MALYPGQALGAVLGEALFNGGCCHRGHLGVVLFTGLIRLPSNDLLNIYYVPSPRDNHEQGSDLLYLYIAHVSRAP